MVQASSPATTANSTHLGQHCAEVVIPDLQVLQQATKNTHFIGTHSHPLMTHAWAYYKC